MTLTVLATRATDRVCEEHGTPITDYLVRGTTLENDWVLSICDECQRRASENQRRHDATLPGDSHVVPRKGA